MKKTVITLFALIASVSAFAGGNGSRSGLPEGNCYIDGEYIGSMTIAECQAKGGKFNNPTK